MPEPSVTVVVPCYNHGTFVRRAVRSALDQRGADVRVVLVNDGSDDGATPEACDRCAQDRVRVIHQPNRGLPAARNAGARGATTEYLVFLDADDWIEPAFCARLHQAIGAEDAAGRGADVSHAYCQERMVERGKGVWRVPDWDPALMMITNLHPVTALVRRDRFEQVGGFNEAMTSGYEDWDLWLRFVDRGWRGVRVREPLFVWRRHSDRTMITGAAGRHAALFRTLVEQHPRLYAAHAPELLARMSALLRRCEMNWLDEDGEPINLREMERQREMYESMAAVRLHRALHRGIDVLPRPLAGLARGVLVGLKRLRAPRPAAPPAPRPGPAGP